MSNEAAQAYANNAKKDLVEKRRAARERIANDPERAAKRLEGVDRDRYDFTGYSDKDIIMAYQGATFGDKDYARLTGNKKDKETKPEPKPVTPINTGGSGPYSGAVNTIKGDGSNIGGITGDGEKQTVIYGDGNVVDHSNFQQYFGDETRIFNAGKGSRGLYSSPVSDATMSGFYDTKDTGRTAAEFLAKYAGANEVWQTRGDKNWKKNGNFDYTTDKYRAINPTAMQERIDRQPIIMRDRGDLHYARLYGDLDQYQAPGWKMPQAPEPIKDNVDEIADDFRDDLG